jgi:hypothetical protein
VTKQLLQDLTNDLTNYAGASCIVRAIKPQNQRENKMTNANTNKQRRDDEKVAIRYGNDIEVVQLLEDAAKAEALLDRMLKERWKGYFFGPPSVKDFGAFGLQNFEGFLRGYVEGVHNCILELDIDFDASEEDDDGEHSIIRRNLRQVEEALEAIDILKRYSTTADDDGVRFHKIMERHNAAVAKERKQQQARR